MKRWPGVVFALCLGLGVLGCAGLNLLVLWSDHWQPPAGKTIGSDMLDAVEIGLILGTPLGVAMVGLIAAVRLLVRLVRPPGEAPVEAPPPSRPWLTALLALGAGGVTGAVTGAALVSWGLLSWIFGPANQSAVAQGWGTPLTILMTPLGAVYGALGGAVLGLGVGGALAFLLLIRK